MYATDMFRIGGSPTPPCAPGLKAAGWTITAYMVGDDVLLAKGPIRTKSQTVYYGYVEGVAGETVAVVRGTDSFVEWIEDFQFAPVIYAPKVALPVGSGATSVEQGFWSIYAGMQLIDPSGKSLGDLAPAIGTIIGPTGKLMVIGHSLGAALATYLTLDLARGGLNERVSACLFASPHPGNQNFVDLFDRAVTEYRVFNYILDIVPRVPLLLGYSHLPRRTVIRPTTAEANIRTNVPCNHHVICYCAMLDYEGTVKATTPVPVGEEASASCILGPETGKPTLAKQLLADLSGVVPV